ncbi:MAG: GNAT family N-acetyltransferase [Crocinitomicaceae bacterium]|nr:GNAT family N-acetyltransferase [Flavobacteriales bacterium]NQZ34578.1 GNAT family N-acetyltransferase [Crocinitomicaceae bacterium]PHR37142.1 MAG: hypothetical protein COA38_00180 [Fluviicola sp.]
MKISNYGLELISLTESDLEMVRNWRNQPDVTEFMFFQEEISPEKQQKWFNSLDESALYLMIQKDGEKIGVINVKDINWRTRTGEAGIFIGDSNYRNSAVPMQAVFAMMDAFFFEFSFAKLKATVKQDNDDGIDFNLQLGYRIESKDNERVQLYIFKNLYQDARTKFLPVLGKFTTSKAKIELSADEKDRFWS